MADTDDALRTFLRRADEIIHEYDNGYMDADAAMSAMETYVEDLRETVDGDG
ncbi:hypothetical protein [Halomarina pelagica]|uniref:hypothetical protein n=1 Tax=Halomarina pelagica TaxID=2961599 RepID=UPI0020C2FCA0|nr:hypothetical protein [Halomarina sp. BND7]